MHFRPLFRVFISAVLFASALKAARPLCTAKNCASYNKRDALTRYQRDVSLVEATPLNSRTLDQPADANHREAVYAARFFEDTSLNSLDTANYASNLLQSGSTGKGKKFDSIVSHINDLNYSPYGSSGFPEVFIITPVKSSEDPVDVGSAPPDTRPASVIGYDDTGALQYSQQTADIVSEITELWPGSDRIHQVLYYPLNSQNTKLNQMQGSPTNPTLPGSRAPRAKFSLSMTSPKTLSRHDSGWNT